MEEEGRPPQEPASIKAIEVLGVRVTPLDRDELIDYVLRATRQGVAEQEYWGLPTQSASREDPATVLLPWSPRLRDD
jgi:hypothetical protein